MEFLSIHHADPVFDHIFSDTQTLSRFLSGPPRFSIFCPWTPIQKCAELARLARKLEEPDDDELVEAVPAPAPPQPASVPRRQRKPSLLTKALREAKKAGIPVASATLTADGSVSLSFGETVKDNGNDLDRWLARRVS
jgi:hypothetical protein